MKSKEIRYEVLFNKTKKMQISLNKELLLLDYNQFIRIQKSYGFTKFISLRKYVLYRFQKIIESKFIEI
jgi:hypothetical protein